MRMLSSLLPRRAEALNLIRSEKTDHPLRQPSCYSVPRPRHTGHNSLYMLERNSEHQAFFKPRRRLTQSLMHQNMPGGTREGVNPPIERKKRI